MRRRHGLARMRFFLGSLGAAGLLWFAEAGLHAGSFGTAFADAILPVDAHELWMRLLVLGTFVGFGGYAQWALNARERAESAIHAEQRRLSMVLASVAEAIVTTDALGHVTDMNPRAEELTGWERDRAMGQQVDQVLPLLIAGADGLRAWRLSDALREAEPIRVPERCRFTREGRTLALAGVGAPLVGAASRADGWVISLRDATAEVAEREHLLDRQRLESVGQLAGGIAHELSSPLTGILNFGELLRLDLPAGSDSLEYADGVVEEAKRMSNILRSLVAYVRDDAKSHQTLELRSLVEPVIVLMNAIYRMDQISVRVDLSDALPRVRGARQALQQVLMNVLTNARDALNARFSGHDDKKQVVVRAEVCRDETGEWVRTTVEDHGCGLPDGTIDQAFAPFFTTKLHEVHTGLGLTVSKMILEDHGGRLLVEAAGEHCTRVHLDLPLLAPEQQGSDALAS